MKAAVVIGFVTAVMFFTASAFAAANGPTKSVYDLKAKQVQGLVGGAVVKHPVKVVKYAKTTPVTVSPAVLNTTVKSSTLPFTGVDLGLFAVAGAVLVGMGVSLRRVTKKHPL
jgi:hypothetical protein